MGYDAEYERMKRMKPTARPTTPSNDTGGYYGTPTPATASSPAPTWKPPAGYKPPQLAATPFRNLASWDSFAPRLSNYHPDFQAQEYPPFNPSGGSGGSGGGAAKFTAAQMQGILDMLGKWRPDPTTFDPYSFTPDEFTAAEYTPYQYQPFEYTPKPRNTEIWDLLLGEIGKRKTRALTGVDKGTEFMQQILSGMTNPYAGGPRTTTPQMAQTTSTLLDPRSQGLVNQNVVDPLNNQSQIFDSGLAAAQGMLGGAWDQSQQSRGLEAGLNDYYYRNKAESDAGNMEFGVGMGNAADAAAYQKWADEMGYGIASQNNQGQNAAGMYNNQGLNDTSRYNNQGINDASRYNNQGINEISAANVSGANATRNTNVTATNDARANAINTILSMISAMPDAQISQLEGLFA